MWNMYEQILLADCINSLSFTSINSHFFLPPTHKMDNDRDQNGSNFSYSYGVLQAETENIITKELF